MFSKQGTSCDAGDHFQDSAWVKGCVCLIGGSPREGQGTGERKYRATPVCLAKTFTCIMLLKVLHSYYCFYLTDMETGLGRVCGILSLLSPNPQLRPRADLLGTSVRPLALASGGAGHWEAPVTGRWMGSEPLVFLLWVGCSPP